MQPFSSTAVIEFEEPASVGGVPVLRYRLEWRIPGQGWTSKEYTAEEGESDASERVINGLVFASALLLRGCRFRSDESGVFASGCQPSYPPDTRRRQGIHARDEIF